MEAEDTNCVLQQRAPPKRTPFATLRQDARQAALLLYRQTEREKVMAVKRVEQLPADIPPHPQPLGPLLLKLLSLSQSLAESGQQQELRLLEEQGACLRQLHGLMCTYPHLLDALAEEQQQQPPACLPLTPSRTSYNAKWTGGLSSSANAYSVLTQVLQQTVALRAAAEASDSQQRRQLVLGQLLLDTCSCLGEMASIAPVQQDAVQLVLPLLVSLLEQHGAPQAPDGNSLQQRLQDRAAFALGSVAATWPSTCAALGALEPALHFLQSAEQQFSLAYFSTDAAAQNLLQQQQNSLCPPPAGGSAQSAEAASGEGEFSRQQLPGVCRLRSAACRMTLAARLCANLRRRLPEPAAAESPFGGVEGLSQAAEVAALEKRIAALVSSLRVEIERQQALLSVSSGDGRRVCVSEVLWCLHSEVQSLPLASVPRPLEGPKTSSSSSQPWGAAESSGFASPAAAAVARAAPDLVAVLLRISEMALQGADRHNARRRQQQLLLQTEEAPKGGQGEQDEDVFRRTRLDATGADCLVPSLLALAVLCAPPRVGLFWGQQLTALSPKVAVELLQELLGRDDHRGVLRAALSLVASLAGGPLQFASVAVSLLPLVASVLSTARSFDIRREAAEAALHFALSNDRLHLPQVLAVRPSVLASFLDLLESSKYDLASVNIALDFLGGVLEHEPSSRALVYSMEGIAKIESVQFLHSDKIDARVSWMVSKYFDGLSDDEEV